MVSLGQVAIYGAAGLAYANLVAADGGNPAAWSPWVAIVAAIAAGTLLGLILGFVSSRSEGIYFLMLTLAFSVLVYYFSSQVTQISGFGGVNNVALPSIVGDPVSDPAQLYFVAMVVCVVLYLWMRYVSRTPFGLSLQGLRDESARMRALGFHVRAHRTLAFTFAAFIASFAGLLSLWYNSRISPGSIDLGQTIDILIIAVIGGLYRLEGAWVGAFAFALLDNYSREWTPSIGNVLGPERFNTLLGIIFLIIVLASPGGLVGLWESGIDRLRRRRQGGSAPRTTTTPGPEGGPAPTTVK
jgi:branched-chain amino acid transport system permease protein